MSTKEGKKDFPEIPFSLLEQVTKELLKVYEKGEKASETGERKDIYIELMLEFMEYQSGNRKNREYLLWILQMLQSNTKLRLSESLSKWVLELGEKMGGDLVYDGLRSHNAKYGKICEGLKSEKSLFMDKDEEIRERLLELTDELQERMIYTDITTFFYDAGYPLTAKEEQSDSRFRKKDKTMDMLDSYCTQHNIVFGNQKAVPDARENLFSEEMYEEYERMYHILNQKKKVKAMVPIVIDSTTGAGIYIMGRDNFKDTPEYNKMHKGKKERFCCYGILEPIDFGEKSVEFDINSEPQCNFPNIKEAIFWFKARIREGSYYEPYRECNGNIPENCPAIFMGYFSYEGEELETEQWVTPVEKEMLLNELNKEQAAYEKEQAERIRKEQEQIRKEQIRKEQEQSKNK